MREVEAQKGLIAEAVVKWSRLSKGQKKFVLVMSLPVSMIVLVVFNLGFILAWFAGQVSVDLLFGNQSDDFLTLVSCGIRNALDYWWVAFTPLVTTPAVLGYIEYKSRHPAS